MYALRRSMDLPQRERGRDPDSFRKWFKAISSLRKQHRAVALCRKSALSLSGMPAGLGARSRLGGGAPRPWGSGASSTSIKKGELSQSGNSRAALSDRKGLQATCGIVHFLVAMLNKWKQVRLILITLNPVYPKYYPHVINVGIISELFTFFLVLGLWNPLCILATFYVLIREVCAVVRVKPDHFGDAGMAAGAWVYEYVNACPSSTGSKRTRSITCGSEKQYYKGCFHTWTGKPASAFPKPEFLGPICP